MSSQPNRIRTLSTRALGAVALLAWASGAWAQVIVWDRQIRVGDLVAFQSIENPSHYYYAGTRARIARESGLPKFSFVRFAEENSEGGEVALGGGIVHALVELGVTEEERERAADALREVDPRGELVGPVAFKSGTFALISSAAGDEEGEVTKRVVGIGQAPLLEGDRAAVSLLLTARGANILWATFNTPTPDISFSFNMTLDAYRAPIEASIYANWAKVYDHENFNAALRAGIDSGSAQVMLGGEIDLTFDELQSGGAIEIDYVGEDEGLERATEAAYADLREIMFAPANVAGDTSFTPDYRDGAYDRASAMFEKAERNRRERNERSRQDRERAIEASGRASGARAQADATPEAIASLEREAEAAEELAAESREAYDRLRQRIEAREGGEAEDQRRDERLLSAARSDMERRERAAESARRRVAEARDAQVERQGEAARYEDEAASREDDKDWEQGTQATVSLYAAYRIKQVKQTGEFRQDMRKYKAETFSLRFDSNVGDFRRYLEDERIFVETALDAMVFNQNEVFVDVSGVGATDFDDFLNSVTVELRKVHENGAVTRKQARLSRRTFEGSDVSLIYVSNGDRDADAFSSYEYKVDWNYAGNVSFTGDWIQHSGPSIPISPPLTEQSFKVRLDPFFADEQGVLGATIRTFTPHAGKEIPGPTLVLEPAYGSDEGYSASTTVLAAPDRPAIIYSAELTLRDGRHISIPRTETTSAIVVLNGIAEAGGQ